MINRIDMDAYNALPTVYDEALSYYETLCQVIKAVNECIDTINNLTPVVLQEKEITTNGEYYPDVGYQGFFKVIVDVEAEDSAVPIEVSTEAEMSALLESGEIGSVYKYTGETTETYENGALYVLEVSE